MLAPTEAIGFQPLFKEKPYLPAMARIVRIQRMVENNYLFTLRFLDDELARGFHYQPGQFVMLSVPGTGEAPISISSTPSRPGVLELCVRRVGRLTDALFRCSTNDLVGIRGPYGNGFPLDRMAGNDLLIAAGGLGMAPLRSLLWYALDHRDRFGKITLMCGARTPQDMLFREELVSLLDTRELSCLLTVDTDPGGAWAHHLGVLPKLFDYAEIGRAHV